MSTLRVTAHRRLEELEPWRASLDALVLASRRPSPFHTIEYLGAFLDADEHEPADSEPLLLVGHDGDDLVGFVALRRCSDPGFGRRRRIELLTTHDTERPGLVARPGDEARCAEAFLRHLQQRERGWTFLELREQDRDSPFVALAGLDRRRYFARECPNNPSTVIHLAGASYAQWLDGVRTHQWRNLARRVRSLLDVGRVEWVACEGSEPALDLLDLYLDVEANSWKASAHAGIARHPRRIELFRRMLRLESCQSPLFHFVLVDGLPVAALLSLRYANVAFGMETAFDRAYDRFTPGNLLFILAVRDVIDRRLDALDLLSNYAYYKARWGATVTETSAVQVYRRWSRYHLRVRLGELRHRLFGAALQQNEATHNLAKSAEPSRDEHAPDAAPRPADAVARRERATRVLASAARTGTLTRLAGDALLAALPADIAPQPVPPKPRRRGMAQASARSSTRNE